MGNACPCGSGATDDVCCAPIIAGTRAPTAVALMRSRYTAYVRGAIDHLILTHSPTTRAKLDREAAAAWSRETRWMGLEIVAVDDGGPDDTVGFVEFVARGITGESAFTQRERSRFERIDGAWYYADGTPSRARVIATAGRNDPCPCGSGTKYKRCHGV